MRAKQKHRRALDVILEERLFMGGCVHTRRRWVEVLHAEGFTDPQIDYIVFRPAATDAPEQCLGACTYSPGEESNGQD